MPRLQFNQMDIFERINLHVEASRQRAEWAKRAIDLLAQGKDNAGMTAAKKAEALDKKVKALEQQRES